MANCKLANGRVKSGEALKLLHNEVLQGRVGDREVSRGEWVSLLQSGWRVQISEFRKRACIDYAENSKVRKFSILHS
jgi:hypothetical protein